MGGFSHRRFASTPPNPREWTIQEDRAEELIEGHAAQQGLAPSEVIRHLQ